jgi:hypothetical protein
MSKSVVFVLILILTALSVVSVLPVKAEAEANPIPTITNEAVRETCRYAAAPNHP